MVENLHRAFVIGHPITHSRSPLIHGHWIAEHGINGRYDAIDVAPGGVAAFLEAVRDGSLAGGNVTVPLKEEAFAAVDAVTPLARGIGAVNTVWRDADGRLFGDNTDIHGFAANLDSCAPAWRSAKSALVVGAGGAARAVLVALLDAGFETIHLVNRTVERAQELARQFGPAILPGGLDEFSACAVGSGFIVNTSSIGMSSSGKESGVAFDFSTAQPGAIVSDIVYVPLETPFLAAARAAGLITVDGLGMLLHQAAPGFERWFGVRPAVTPHLRALIEADLFGRKA